MHSGYICRGFSAEWSRLVFPKTCLVNALCFWHPEREMHFVNKMEKLNTKIRGKSWSFYDIKSYTKNG